ncbi:hypothetical protein BP5796_09190 [Coleophoma crateriformis]|uniref:TauD/TfdA-like domain-containing protein n=1 Tax=Coleophoma crateriformis TaxID=565419 RepID=A0A3D8R3A8_9HELO|nr:hypothetical protein BP5796_09190 [Coleophoma crateriformis]
MAKLAAYENISQDSGFPTTLHPNFNPHIRNHETPDPVREEISPPKDRAFFADSLKSSLLSVTTATDLTESIGTVLSDVQLSKLNEKQLDELALFVNEPGVVFFRDQDLTTEEQVKLFQHYAPSYSLLRLEEHPAVGGDTAWYGLYDALSDPPKKLVEGLHAVHTSHLQYDMILDLWAIGPNRPPIDTHCPAVRTHPVTGLKALNVNPGFNIHSAGDHYVRWKWEVGSVAMWDNRCTVHRVIPGNYKELRMGVQTTVFGEKPYLDPRARVGMSELRDFAS